MGYILYTKIYPIKLLFLLFIAKACEITKYAKTFIIFVLFVFSRFFAIQESVICYIAVKHPHRLHVEFVEVN